MKDYPLTAIYLAAVGLGVTVASGWMNWLVGVVFLTVAALLVARTQRNNRKDSDL